MTKNQLIRAFCLDCCCGSIVCVRECHATKCPLYAFKMGVETANPDVVRVNRTKAIKLKCAECNPERNPCPENCIIGVYLKEKKDGKETVPETTQTAKTPPYTYDFRPQNRFQHITFKPQYKNLLSNSTFKPYFQTLIISLPPARFSTLPRYLATSLMR